MPDTVLFVRYNYNCGAPRTQLSTYPALPVTNFHFYEYYAPLNFPR